jgi:hypothetical protein
MNFIKKKEIKTLSNFRSVRHIFLSLTARITEIKQIVVIIRRVKGKEKAPGKRNIRNTGDEKLLTALDIKRGFHFYWETRVNRSDKNLRRKR